MKIGGTMDKIGCGKWGAWRAALGVLLCFVVAITAQPGFLSIDCGGKTDYTDLNNIRWVGDADYIDHLGETADIGNATDENGAHLTSLRFFPKPLYKSCYHLPVDPHVPYLLRLWFAVGNYSYSGFQEMPSFAVSFETMGTLYMRNITIADRDPIYYERILASSGTMLYICLIRNLESVDPFISAIELRKLQDGMYGHAKPGTILKNIWRTDVGGGNSTIRYPQDYFDRIWTPYVPLNVSSLGIGQLVSSSTLINDNEDFPPPLVMQTAWLLNSSVPAQFSLGPFIEGGRKSLLLLYFAETEILDMSESRSFYVTINGEKVSDSITLPRNYSAVDLTILSNQTDNFQFALVSTSSLPALINAFEYYTVFDSQPPTYLQDSEALVRINETFNMSTWISDPCFLIPWNGISCHNNPSAIRISEITLSRRNLTGLVPAQIGQLTALVNMALDHNHLTGPLPDFSNLTMLERLHLQNNNLNGRIPNWLSELKNLKELFIDNNNFSGEIPPRLLQKPSLNLQFSGNPYLSIPREHKKSIPMEHKKLREPLILGTILSGVLIIGLLLMASIFFYCKNKDCVTTESNEVEIAVYSTSNEWTNTTIMAPNSARAFTRDQIMAATQQFSGSIGKGGFGSVFFGKLPEGNNIAVKVLSLFSTQGVDQFRNEMFFRESITRTWCLYSAIAMNPKNL